MHASWAIVALFVCSIVLQSLDRSLLAAVQPSVLANFQLDQSGYSRLVATFSIAYGLSAPVMGILIDRYGFRLVSAAAVTGWSLVGMATGFTTTMGGLMICRTLLGLFESAGLPAAGKAYSTYLSKENRTFGTALNQVALTIGSVAAVLMAGWLTPLYGWRSNFLLAGPLGLVWVAAWLAKSREPSAASGATNASPSMPLGSILRDFRLWALLGANILTMPLYTLWTNWTTSYLSTTYGFTEAVANLRFAWLPPVFAMAGGIGGGFVTRYMLRGKRTVQSARYWVALVGSVGILSTALVPFAKTPELGAFGIGLSFFFTVWISVNLYAMSLDMFGEGRAGFAFSMLTSVYGLMQAVVSTQIGRVVDQYGFAPACYLGSVLPICGLLLLRLARGHR